MVDARLKATRIEYASAYTRDEGRAAALRMLKGALRPSAIVAANDLLALGVYDALAALGLDCPRDVSVIGHNDMPYVDMLAPALTTIRIRQREIGREAARILVARIAGVVVRNKRVTLGAELIVRASTSTPG